MGMYKRIAEITGEEEYGELYEEFTDRFGTLPESVETLMRLSLIKALGARAGLCAVRIQSGLAQLKFGGCCSGWEAYRGPGSSPEKRPRCRSASKIGPQRNSSRKCHNF